MTRHVFSIALIGGGVALAASELLQAVGWYNNITRAISIGLAIGVCGTIDRRRVA